jgi:hypothetical protein
MADINGNAPERPQKRMQNTFAIKFLVDDVPDRTRAGELQHDCIDPRNVIGQEKKSALRQVLPAERSNAVKTMHQRAREKMQRPLSGRHGGHCL